MTSNTYLVMTSDDLRELCFQIIEEARKDWSERKKEESTEVWGTREDAAKFLKCSMPTIYSLIDEGLIVSRTVGRRRLINMEELKKSIRRGDIRIGAHRK